MSDREAFEEFARRELTDKLTRDSQGNYADQELDTAWIAWQAALAAQQKAAPTITTHDNGGFVSLGGGPSVSLDAEPVAWMHDEPGRVDVIHNSVKELWREVMTAGNFLTKPNPVEHYTIPLVVALASQQKADPNFSMSKPLGWPLEQQKAEPVKEMAKRLVQTYLPQYADPPLDPEGIRLLREARDKTSASRFREELDAYLAKYPVNQQT